MVCQRWQLGAPELTRSSAASCAFDFFVTCPRLGHAPMNEARQAASQSDAEMAGLSRVFTYREANRARLVSSQGRHSATSRPSVRACKIRQGGSPKQRPSSPHHIR